MFTLAIDTSTTAFDNGNEATELVRILRDAARKIEEGGVIFYLLDKNGNRVSRCEMRDD